MDLVRTTEKDQMFQPDSSPPRWLCQNCHQPISFSGAESHTDKYLNDSAWRAGAGAQAFLQNESHSMSVSTGLDTSFVVLPKLRSHATRVPGDPNRGGGALHPISGMPAKPMEESFVVVHKSEPPVMQNAAGPDLSSSRSNRKLQHNSGGLHSTLSVLQHAFDIATSQTQVEQPQCIECMKVLSDKLDKEVEDVNRDIEAYESCLERLQREMGDVVSEADFLKEKQKIEEEERKLDVAIKEAEKQNAQVNTQLKELELKSDRFKELEERYWQEFNNFQFQLISHQEEKDAILAKIEVSQAHLELLKKSNVLNDAFPINHDGEFGTINNFRLGRLPKIPVDWDEINAAWGQACLLLHTMCQYFKPKFQYQIKMIPMGSYPRIMDANNNIYELFGPVNLFWSTRYDKAMTLFLACLKDFSEFAASEDQDNNIPFDKRFKLPYKIESDKVDNYSITQSFNKQENWTKALKYTLCNLKWALYWFIGNTNFQPLTSTASPPN